VVADVTHIASDWVHGNYCPTTQGRERLAREDERTSLELSVRLGLKSARGEGVPKPPVRSPSKFTGPKPEPRVVTKAIAEKRKRTPAEMTVHGLHSLASKLRKRIAADPSDRWSRQQLGECEAEFQRRVGGNVL
jgi:hypothetical protein